MFLLATLVLVSGVIADLTLEKAQLGGMQVPAPPMWTHPPGHGSEEPERPQIEQRTLGTGVHETAQRVLDSSCHVLMEVGV